MSSSLLRRTVNLLASVPLTVILLVIFAVATAAATFVESNVGTVGAKALVYNARWFEVLLALLTLNLILALERRIPFRPQRTGFLLVHIAMIVILVAAGMTRYLGHEGTMRIREGETVDFMWSREDHIQVGVDGELASFPVRLYRAGPQSAGRTLTIGGEDYRVAVSEYWPHYDSIMGGPGADRAVLDLTVNEDGGASVVALQQGRRQTVGSVRIAYLDDTKLSSVGEHRLGNLEIRAGGATGDIVITEEPGEGLSVGGFQLHRHRIPVRLHGGWIPGRPVPPEQSDDPRADRRPRRRERGANALRVLSGVRKTA